MNGGVKSGDPVLDVGVGPAVGDVALEGWVWRLQDVGQNWWPVCRWSWWVGWFARACGVAGTLQKQKKQAARKHIPFSVVRSETGGGLEMDGYSPKIDVIV